MSRRGRRRGGDWTRLSAIPVSLEQAPGITEQLSLRRAWIAVAGEDLARRLTPVGRRGEVLLLRLSPPRWQGLLPVLEARLLPLMGAYPVLAGIRRLEGRVSVSPGVSASTAPAPGGEGPVRLATDASPRARLAVLAAEILRGRRR
ncbi:MAG: hypothetical protein ACE5IK_14440 [Acidobacteriota bacterium]